MIKVNKIFGQHVKLKNAPVKFGLIGVGRWGSIYVRTISSMSGSCLLSWLCTSRPENARLVPTPVKITRNWRDLIASSDCDAVIVATPPETHAEIANACIDAGKPCIVEKPFCTKLSDATALSKKILKKNALVLIDHTHLFNPAYIALKKAVGSKPVRFILSEGSNLGPFRYHTDALWDWCPHDISMCLDITGKDPVKTNVLCGPKLGGIGAELIDMTLDFGGKTSALIHAGRLTSHKRRTFTVFTDRMVYEFSDIPTATLKAASFDIGRRYENGGNPLLDWKDVPFDTTRKPMQAMVEYFIKGMRGKPGSLFSPRIAVETVKILSGVKQ